MKKLSFILVLFIIVSSFLSGCGQKEASNAKKDDNQLKVYTTVYPLQYFTQQIGAEFVDVKTIYPPGADEHTFEPSQKDMISLADADLFFYIGLGLEGFVDKAEQTLKNEGVKMLPVGDSLHLDGGNNDQAEETHSSDDGHGHGDINPHVWLDPIYANEIALTIKNQLVEQMPEHKDVLEKNYAELSAQLTDLDKEFTEVIRSADRKEIIVSHAAYSYWETRYGLKQINISGLSTTNEPTQQELQNLISHAKDAKIKYVLTEQNFNSKLAKMVQDEIGGKTLTLHNLSVLTDEDIKNNETYFTLMKKNISTLEKALNE
ncbi:metal ABC transporter solute-binding protein, Zn/Mn family [Mesobacillus stamsii]|uniref:Zinc transport system substrate-binding protein n=1 Tax=Mesobacillus stamsii TaxID=225347 RepID=A0ABU0FUT4_9BACI|nr:zinc ABC transporter substrate-binding protein [Mesobacillus stamsii]MDQ0413097.1 zinc transport system substrate-binding protein [Mesobacillus stamsii]